MAKTCIGLDIGPNWIKAVQMTRDNSGYRIQRYHSALMRRKTDDPAAILKELSLRHGFNRRAPLVVNLPPDSLFQQTPPPDAAVNAPSVSPLPPDQSILSNCPASDDPAAPAGQSVMRRSIYHHLLDLTGKARLRCRRMISAARAVYCTVLTNHPELVDQDALILYEDTRHCFILVSSHGRLLNHRAFPARSSGKIPLDTLILQEIDLTWHTLFNDWPGPQTPVYVASRAGDRIDLINTLTTERHYRIIEADPFAVVLCPEEYREDYTLCLCEGLALHYLNAPKSDPYNLLHTNASTSAADGAQTSRRQLILASVLLGITLLAYATGVLLQRWGLENQYQQLKDQIRNRFAAAAPGETQIVDELAQLEQITAAARSEAKLLEPWLQNNRLLDNWALLQQNTPSELLIQLEQIQLEPQAIKLIVTAPGLQQMERWKQILQSNPDFSQIVMTPQPQPDNNPAALQLYNVTITLSKEPSL